MPNEPMPTKPMAKFTNAMSTGLKTLTGSNTATFYELEHKRSCDTYKRGDINRVIVDYATLGRDEKSTIAFKSTDKTVSRLHAAIERKGDAYQLIHLSHTNPTILNGSPISSPTSLKSGDEIELSLGGPKFSFLIPGQNTVGSLPLSARFNLMRDQVLKPYKAALTVLAVVLFISMLGGGYGIYTLNNELTTERERNDAFSKLISEQTNKVELLKTEKSADQQKIAQISEANEKLTKDLTGLKATVRKLKETTITAPTTAPSQPAPNQVLPQQQAEGISSTYNNILFVTLDKIHIQYEDGTEEELDASFTGTGFVTDDGYVVTARHVAEPWNFINDQSPDQLVQINIILNNSKAKAYSHLVFTNSQNGQSVQMNSDQMVIQNEGDVVKIVTDSKGQEWMLNNAFENPRDIAYKKMNTSWSGLRCNKPLSQNLTALTPLYVVGYPWGLGEKTNPIASQTQVGSTGLVNGLIITNSPAFDHGNSGGPVFVYNNNQYEVVGLVSGGMGTATGMIVPIAYIK